MMRQSIRRRLMVTLSLSLLLTVVAAGWLLVRVTDRQLEALFDQGLFEQARTFTNLIEWEEGWLEISYSSETMAQFEPGQHANYFEIRDGDLTIGRSASLNGQSLLSEDQALPEIGFHDLPGPDGCTIRLIAMTFMPIEEEAEEDYLAQLDGGGNEGKHHLPIRKPLTLLIARDRFALDQQIESINHLILSVLGLLALVLLATTIVQVDFGLKPLKRLAGQVGRIRPHELANAIDPEQFPAAELKPIAVQITLLLARIENMLTREREFSSHVAHELRTPVAELKAISDVLKSSDVSHGSSIGLIEDLSQLSIEMTELIESLLTLARSEEDEDNLPTLHVSIEEVLSQVVSRLDLVSVRRLSITSLESVQLRLPPGSLQIMMGNLLSNALQYSPVSSPIEISWVIHQSSVDLVIQNEAPDLDQDDVSHMMDRFWRSDSSRSGRGHLGIGLSICHALAERYGWTLRFELDQAGILRVHLGGIPLGH